MGDQVAVVRHTRPKAMLSNGPSFSVIIEWDNARLSEVDRARQMLKALQEQSLALDPKPDPAPQIVILYDKHEIDVEFINSVVRESIDMTRWEISLRVVATDGLRYYQLKNFGVPLTDREIVIFLDSDVIPESGWLAGIMEAMERPDVSVVGGNTYVAHETFLEKAFALFWFFPLRSTTTQLHTVEFFYANNVAFRRSVLERYPFPELDSFRGQCYVLCQDLRRNGIEVYRQESSRVSHPSPNGVKHLLHRAVCHGHDEMTLQRVLNTGGATLLGACKRFVSDLRSAARRSIDHHQVVGLSSAGAVGAFGFGTGYAFLKLWGEVITYFNPAIVRKYWPI